MGFNAFLNSRYATTHENRFWNKLVSELKLHYENKTQYVLIVGNLIVDGKQLDAVVIKDDAIVVIDFKNYGGTLQISENRNWSVSGTLVNSGRNKNPFSQLLDNKFGLLQALDKRLDAGYKNWINLGHINAIVLFHQDIEYDNENISRDLSQSASKWFSITDLRHICQTLDEITSNQTLINYSNLTKIVSALGLEEIPEYDLILEEPVKDSSVKIKPNGVDEDGVESKIAKIEPNSFAENYYDAARALESIELLIIGQDPYPNGGNGVAFCKTSMYGLYQEGCCGGIVLASLGYSRRRAFDSYENSRAMFLDLLKFKGICFTNVNPQKISLQEIINSPNDAINFNLELIKKAKKIVLLGKGQTKDYFERLFKGYHPTHILIHPSLRNENLDEWSKTWQGDTLKKILESQN
jgi:Nuclease-related domain